MQLCRCSVIVTVGCAWAPSTGFHHLCYKLTEKQQKKKKGPNVFDKKIEIPKLPRIFASLINAQVKDQELPASNHLFSISAARSPSAKLVSAWSDGNNNK